LEKDLGIEAAIQNLNAEQLLDADTFAVIDKKIIIGIREHIVKIHTHYFTGVDRKAKGEVFLCRLFTDL
jgi:hypothetical protein